MTSSAPEDQWPAPSRFEVRAALPKDAEALLQLAQHLNTVNLPNDRDHVVELLEHSRASFSGELASPVKRKYVLLLWDHEQQRAVGTSSIIAQLGRRDAPYIYLDVLDEEKYSKALDKHFHHTTLRIGFSYDGPTELGGLVVDPAFRGHPLRLGRLISFARFALIKAKREWFQDQLLAELLPPLEPDGKSHLWEAVGHHFTDMSYAEADLLSSKNKEFIRDLFPSGLIYASLLSPEAQRVIGEVGEQTRGVQRLLERVGFRYARRVDPFDGGPHFTANTDEVSVVRASEALKVSASNLHEKVSSPPRPSPHYRPKQSMPPALRSGDVQRLLVTVILPDAPFVRAAYSLGRVLPSTDDPGPTSIGSVELPRETRDGLELQSNQLVYCSPLR